MDFLELSKKRYSVLNYLKKDIPTELINKIDASIVTTHMMVEATSLGLGSIWVMYWNPQTMKEEFEIPEQYESVALLIVGYADEKFDPHKEHFIRKEIEDIVF